MFRGIVADPELGLDLGVLIFVARREAVFLVGGRLLDMAVHADGRDMDEALQARLADGVLGQQVRERRNGTTAVLAELAQLESAASAEIVTLVGELPNEHANDPGNLSTHDFAVVSRYVLRKALATKALRIE